MQYVVPSGTIRLMLFDLARELPTSDTQLWQDAHHSPCREFTQLPPVLKAQVLKQVDKLSPSQVFALCEAADKQNEMASVDAYVQSALSVLGLGSRNQTLVSQLRNRAATALLILLANYQAEETKKALGLTG